MDRKEELGLEDVLPFDRPMSSSSNDKWTGSTNEWGDKIYITPLGKKYTVREASSEERAQREPLSVKAQTWWEEGANLPSWAQIADTITAMPGQVYDTAKKALAGEATVGDALGFVPAMGAVGVGSRLGVETSDDILSAMGATYRVPRYKKKESFPKKEDASAPAMKNGIKFPLEKNVGDLVDSFNVVEFRDPLLEILEEMEIPSNGLKGSQLLKELQNNPTIRNSQLKSQEFIENIDPEKRYNIQEISRLFPEDPLNVSSESYKSYEDYQRQKDLLDPEINYSEYPVNIINEKFVANNQHYAKNTLAHVRLSDRQGTNGPYTLIEELQSDLLQHGWVKPVKPEKIDPKTFFDFDNVFAKLPEYVDTEYLKPFLESFTPDEKEKWLSLTDSLEQSSFIHAKVGSFLDTLPLFKDGPAGGLFEVMYYLTPAKQWPPLQVPPISKTAEGVRLALDTAIAHAANSGISRIVIPPLHKIVEKRFYNQSEIDNALDPKNGFYQTYITSIQKFIDDLKKEFGDSVNVGNYPLNYRDKIDPDETTGWSLNFDGTPDPIPEKIPLDSEKFLNTFEDILSYRVGIDFETLGGWEGINAALKREQYDDFPTDIDTQIYTSLRQVMRELYPNNSVSRRFFLKVADGMPFKDAYEELFRSPKEPPSIVEQGVYIDFKGLADEGYDLSRPRFAEGGVVTDSMNPVPPGAKPEEVRDDVPIMASEGEYIIPANVVRFLGLDKLEKMVNKAKEQLHELDAAGRIGGEDESLPFTAEELQKTEEAPSSTMPGMAAGGLVLNPTLDPNSTEVDPVTGLPLWLVGMQGQGAQTSPQTTQAPVAPRTNYRDTVLPERDMSWDRSPDNTIEGLAGSVDNWTPHDFNRYASTRNELGPKIGQAFTSLIPGASVMARMRQNYLKKTVPERLNQMISTGTDLQGNTLDRETMSQLRDSYSRIQNEPLERRSALGALRSVGEREGLIKPRESRSNDNRNTGGGLFEKIKDFISGDNKPREGLISKSSSSKQAPPAPTKLNGPKKDDKKKK